LFKAEQSHVPLGILGIQFPAPQFTSSQVLWSIWSHLSPVYPVLQTHVQGLLGSPDIPLKDAVPFESHFFPSWKSSLAHEE